MKIFEYRAAKLVKTSRIFSDDIRNDPWVLFHGTSACWEKQIESEGLNTVHLPVSLRELRDVMRIFKSMNWRCSNHVSSLGAWSFPNEVNGTEFRPIYLASEPELAACYCGRRSAGGEVAEMVRGCIRELRSFLRNAETRSESIRGQLVEYEEFKQLGQRARVMEVSRAWLRNEICRLAPLERRLIELGRGRHCGIVYALRFEKEDVVSLRGSQDTYVSDSPIPPNRIIAKVRIIGRECDHLDRRTARFFRDYQDPSTLMGAIVARREAPAPCLTIEEWDRVSIDPTAGVDLAERFGREELLRHLRRRHPTVFADEKRCREYGW